MLEKFTTGIAVDITGILSLLFMAFSVVDREDSDDRGSRSLFEIFLVLIALMSSDIICNIYNGRADAAAVLHVVYTAELSFSMLLNLVFFSHVHLELKYQKSDWRILNGINVAINLLAIAAILLNPIHRMFFTVSEAGSIFEGPYFILLGTISGLNLAICVLQILCRKGIKMKKRLTMLVYCLLPISSLLLRPFFNGVVLPNMGALSTALIIYVDSYLDQYMEVSSKEIELQNTRAALVLSQIQPHFLFNSMTAVMDLCDTDPQEAKAAIQELSDYLHYKISALSNNYVVPFAEDMEFVQNYLKLEKRRFGDRLRVEWDIRTTNFSIPLLTLQPLVENCIRHGINKRPEGGTIRISSRETENSFRVTVEDNGMGFDAEHEPDPVGQHVGLANVRARLGALSGGLLLVRSAPGVGTTVEIVIKKEKGKGHK